MKVQIERIYEKQNGDSAFRILVDRIWPRGVSKEKAHLDVWFRDIAPSTELRVWFGHKPERFAEFKARYLAEIDINPETPVFLKLIKSHQNTVLLYGAKDTRHNHALVLRDYLADH